MNIKKINVIGNSGIIINGKVVDGGKNKGELKKFDELKKYDANRVSIIDVETSSTDVTFTPTEGSNLEVSLKGEAYIDGKLDFDIMLLDYRLTIKVKINGSTYNENLKLEVKIPDKVFPQLSIKTSSADVVIEKGISVKRIDIETASGDLKSDVEFSGLDIHTMSGNIDLKTFAKSDIQVKINTMSGDVSARFGNVKYMDFEENTMSGCVEDNHKETIEGYVAQVDIYTMSGDIYLGNLEE